MEETMVAHSAGAMAAWMAVLKAGLWVASKVARLVNPTVVYWAKKLADHWVAPLVSWRAVRLAVQLAIPKAVNLVASKAIHWAEQSVYQSVERKAVH